jgi:SNF2 Helicase protein
VSPPRNRRQADIDSERARRALRALLADPAANFAALPADEFFAALKSACRDGAANPALTTDAERRITSAEAGPRELHQVLFAARDHQAWSGVRAVAMEAVVRGPAMAVAVLALEAQRLGVAPMQVTESAAGDGFSARASVERDGVRVEGEAGYGSSKKAARQAAALSLLAELTGLVIPDEAPSVASQVRSAAPELTAAELESWLDYEVGKPAPDPEFAGAVRSGRLSARSVYLLLFEADPGGWAEARADAWEALVSTPSMAGGVLSMYSQARSLPTAGYIGTGEYSAVAFLSAAGGLVVGAPCLAAGSKAARAAAALALLRDLAPSAALAGAGASAGSGGLAGAGAERNPVTVLNERAQTGVITALSYAQDASGPPHEPVFTCTAGCTHATGRYTWIAEGRSKNEAKAAAAAGLLDQITAQQRSAVAQLARAAEAEARSPRGIFERLLRGGCALDFCRDAWFRVSHPAGAGLPGPLAGWAVPLLAALPVLAALDPNAVPLHESARTWASVARSAVEAVAAQRVYPALDDEGRDCWRLAADIEVISPGLPEFLDAVADALLRPPGARLVTGDVPYAGRARVLENDAAEWADRCAEAADPAPSAPMSVRIQPPADGGSPLRAELHAPRLGHAEHRALRRATRGWPPLGQIRRDGALGGADAVDLLGPAGELLAAHGITVEWPGELAVGLGTGTVARCRPGLARSAAGSFSLGDIVDLNWQLTLDGDPLSEAEAQAVAAAEGLVRLRGRWVLVGRDVARRARERRVGELTGAQALSAALTGQIAVDGRDVACAAGVGRCGGRRGAAGEEPSLAGGPGAPVAVRHSADRSDRHAGRELAVGAVGHPGLDESRAVRNPPRVPRTLRPRRRAGGRRRCRPAAGQAHLPVPHAPPQGRPGRRARAAREGGQ